MSAYRDLKVIIEPKSAFLTPLVADTLWGHLIWAEIYSGGEIDEWVDVENPEPPIILSDVFPESWLPAPVMAIPMARLRKLIAAAAGDDRNVFARLAGIAKHLTKLRELPEDVVKLLLRSSDMAGAMIDAIAQTFDATRCPQCLAEVGCNPACCPMLSGSDDIDHRRACETKLNTVEPRRQLLPSRHTAVDRLTGTAGEGLLFDHGDVWLGGTWTCWVRTTLEADHVERLMRHVGESGYGKRASVGRGRFEVIAVEEHSPLSSLQPRQGRYMLLSSSLMPHQGFQLGEHDYYRIRVKRGKRHNTSHYIKRPVVMFEAGSLFCGKCGTHVGRLVRTGKADDHPIVEYGIAYPLAF